MGGFHIRVLSIMHCNQSEYRTCVSETEGEQKAGGKLEGWRMSRNFLEGRQKAGGKALKRRLKSRH